MSDFDKGLTMVLSPPPDTAVIMGLFFGYVTFTVVASVVIVFVEAAIFRRLSLGDFWKSFGLSFKANLASAFFGGGAVIAFKSFEDNTITWVVFFLTSVIIEWFVLMIFLQELVGIAQALKVSLTANSVSYILLFWAWHVTVSTW